MGLKCDESDCYFEGVHMGYLGLFANYFSLKSLRISLKSHMNVL